jgi:hypothetical protein
MGKKRRDLHNHNECTENAQRFKQRFDRMPEEAFEDCFDVLYVLLF